MSMITRELIEEKSFLGLWKVSDGINTVYKITDDGHGICNSVEEMSGYYFEGTETDLVNEILKRGNTVIYTDDLTYTEYMAQFEDYKNGREPKTVIYPYCNFESYEKAKEIWDLLSEI